MTLIVDPSTHYQRQHKWFTMPELNAPALPSNLDIGSLSVSEVHL